MRFCVFVVLVAFFSGCASVVSVDESENKKIINDLNLPQKSVFYVSDSKEFESDSLVLKQKYLERFFSVWNEDFAVPKKSEIFWGLNVKSGFDESKKPIDASFFSDIESRMQIDSYPSLKQKAIMVKTANARVLPTNKPRFSSIDGYPFDRWQNSIIFAFTPVLALHQDSTKEWILVQSSFVSGWVKSDEVAFVSDKMAKNSLDSLKNKKDSRQSSKNTNKDSAKKWLVPLKDKIPLYYEGNFVANARIGMLFEAQDDKIYIYQRDLKGNAIKTAIPINATNKGNFAPFPLLFNQINISNIIDSLIPQNYGWGGMYENRDCSAFIRDVFSNFAIWLPRNSKAQVNYAKNNLNKNTQNAANGTNIAPKNGIFMELPKENDKKIEFIKEHGKAFRTIIWLKGHIMLYIGERDGVPLVIHDVWSIKTSAGEQILSGIYITTLTPGAELNDEDSQKTLLDRIEAINILTD